MQLPADTNLDGGTPLGGSEGTGATASAGVSVMNPRNSLNKDARISFSDDVYRTWKDQPAIASEFFQENCRLLRFLIPDGATVLEIGCGTGDVLHELRPSRGVGLDYSKIAIERAALKHPGLEFIVADAEEAIAVEGTFDFVLINLAVGEFLDAWKVFRNIRGVCRPETRIVLTYYNFLWDPALSLATKLGLRRRSLTQNWFSLHDLETLLALNGFELVSRGTRVLCPLPIPILAPLCNRVLAGLPLISQLNLLTYCVARPLEGDRGPAGGEGTVSIIIPTRNERGNIQDAVERAPRLGSSTELIFVDGDSSDGTVEEIERQIAMHPDREIKLIHQVPRNTSPETKKMLKLGKGDAVRKGFAAATGDVLMILDSDLTVPPEDMEKFYLAIAEGRGEFINGNRLSYPMEQQAMRFLNLVANRFFGIAFTWLLGQRVKDTLCGTKVLTKRSYERIAANRAFFGDFDPFGDFDLLFGAAKQNMKIVDLPVRYRARTYGDIKIERFKHGMLLLRMCWFAFQRFKLQ